MTVLGWDASQYDGTLTTGILQRAKAEGVAFFTHKIGEGTGVDDPDDHTALAAARVAGIEFIGGYYVPRSGGAVDAQVSRCIALADRDEPWWRTFPGWFFQVDLERWPYDSVAPGVGISFARELRARTGRLVILYASNGQYDNGLTGWDGPLWNAHYVDRVAGAPAAMYPGDGWLPSIGGRLGGWAAYSGRAPVFLQYTSAATIAGLTTCDANAFRGSIEQLRALITGGSAMSDVDIPDTRRLASNGDTWGRAILSGEDPAQFLGGTGAGYPATATNVLHHKLDAIMASVAALHPTSVALTDAQVQAVADRLIASPRNALTTADHAAVIADVQAALRAGTG